MSDQEYEYYAGNDEVLFDDEVEDLAVYTHQLWCEALIEDEQ